MAHLFKKKVKGRTYYYLGENKRVNGKVRKIWQKYIGPADKIAQLLENPVPAEVDFLDFGICAATLHIAEKLDFVEIVNKIISKREQGLSYGEHLLITISNRLDNPKSKNKLGDWFDGTVLKRIFSVKKTYISSQNFWNHWNKINDTHIEEIQEALLEKLVSQCDITDLVFDPTNFESYIEQHKNQKIMQFGHSKSGRKGFRQVNLSLLISKKEGIPLWHRTYDGNINDVTEFKEFVKILTKRVSFFSKKCKKITIIFDKGNNSKNNIKNISKKLHFYMVGSLKPSMFPELFDIPMEEFNEEYITSGNKKVFCTSKEMDVYDGKKKVVVTYSNELAYKNRIRVEKALNKALKNLEMLKKRVDKFNFSRDEVLIKVERIVGRPYLKGLITYEIEGDGVSLTYSQDEEAYKKVSKRFGKNILFTDDLSLATIDIVKMYSDKNIVEEQIKKLKDKHVISFTPMWCWTDKMIKVHAFTCVMALLFLRLMTKYVQEAKMDISQNEMIEQLDRIKLSLLKMPRTDQIQAKMTRLNEIQRKLVSLFELRKYT